MTRPTPALAMAAALLLVTTLARTDRGTPTIETALTPPPWPPGAVKTCKALTLHHLQQAEWEVLIQAYDFRDADLADTLLDLHRRGVAVRILLDTLAAREGQGPRLAAAGIPIATDAEGAGIAHNKIAIIDRKVTLSGSYNWTAGGATKNAENVLAVTDPTTADTYRANFLLHAAHSKPFPTRGP